MIDVGFFCWFYEMVYLLLSVFLRSFSPDYKRSSFDGQFGDKLPFFKWSVSAGSVNKIQSDFTNKNLNFDRTADKLCVFYRLFLFSFSSSLKSASFQSYWISFVPSFLCRRCGERKLSCEWYDNSHHFRCFSSRRASREKEIGFLSLPRFAFICSPSIFN